MSPSPALSPSPTPAVSLTPDAGPALSLTPHSSETPASSPTSVPEASSSSTPNSSLLTPHLSETPTITSTPTATGTPTFTVTPTPSPTLTATSTPGIVSFSVEPKPLKERAALHWELAMPVDRVSFKVYTSSFRLVKTRHFLRRTNPVLTSPGPVVVEWDIRDDRGKPLAPGHYFLYLKAKSGSRTWEARDQARVP